MSLGRFEYTEPPRITVINGEAGLQGRLSEFGAVQGGSRPTGKVLASLGRFDHTEPSQTPVMKGEGCGLSCRPASPYITVVRGGLDHSNLPKLTTTIKVHSLSLQWTAMIQVHPYPSHCTFIHSSALSSIPVHFRNPGALYCIPVHSHDLSALSYITSPIFFVTCIKCKFKLAESCLVSSSSNSPALPQAKFKLACTTSSHSPLTTSSQVQTRPALPRLRVR